MFCGAGRRAPSVSDGLHRRGISGGLAADFWGKGRGSGAGNNKGEIAENSGRSYICLPKRRRKETGEVGHTGMPA